MAKTIEQWRLFKYINGHITFLSKKMGPLKLWEGSGRVGCFNVYYFEIISLVRLARSPGWMSLFIMVEKRTLSWLRTVLNCKPIPLPALTYRTVALARISPSSTRK